MMSTPDDESKSGDDPIKASSGSKRKASEHLVPPGDLTEDKEEQRLELNRVRARERRKRDKVMWSQMQQKIVNLTSENNELKTRVQMLETELGRSIRATHVVGGGDLGDRSAERAFARESVAREMALGAYARAGGLGEPSLVGMSVGGMVGAAAGLGYPHHIDYYSPNAVGMPGGAASRAAMMGAAGYGAAGAARLAMMGGTVGMGSMMLPHHPGAEFGDPAQADTAESTLGL